MNDDAIVDAIITGGVFITLFTLSYCICLVFMAIDKYITKGKMMKFLGKLLGV